VHRDVKPDNVMLDDDGRVRVMDFGLATTHGGDTSGGEDSADLVPARQSLRESLTRAGATPGTPAYMAPEQFAGETADGRTDQFSYCVTLWEALYGERPFAGDSRGVLAANVLAGTRRPAPRGAKVPGWLRRIIERGLVVDPAHRWPGLQQLHAALQEGESDARRRRVLLGVGGVAALGLLALGAQRIARSRAVSDCETEGAEIERIWNAAVRDAVREGLLATGVNHAAKTADKVIPRLDDNAAAWRHAETEACLRTRVDGEWDADTFDRAQWCLQDRRSGFAALVDRLTQADGLVVNGAVAAAAGLDEVESCLDASWLQRLPVPPAEVRPAIEAVRGDISRARTLAVTGAYAEELTLAQDCLERATALRWLPLIASARGTVGRALADHGRFEEAERALEAAYFEAAAAGASSQALDLTASLVFAVGYSLARHEEGLRWGKHGELLRTDAVDPSGYAQARLLHHLAVVREASGDTDLAIATHERALELMTAALGDDHPNLARIRVNLGTIYAKRGESDAARRLLEEAVEVFEETLGLDHPDVAQALNNLANVEILVGDHDKARVLLTRSLAIREAAFGPDHVDVAETLHNLGNLELRMGDYAAAGVNYERAAEIRRVTLGPRHPAVAGTLHNLGVVAAHDKRYAEAFDLHQQALEIEREALGPDHPSVATGSLALGAAALQAGDLPAARDAFERGLALRTAEHGPDHSLLATPLDGLARIDLKEGRFESAARLAERSLALRETSEPVNTDLADARFLTARTLVAAGRDHARARALAQLALEVFAEEGPRWTDQVERIRQWLDEQNAGGGREARPRPE
jgi:tetratricopeptide (TPR) repeat protein